MTVGELRELLSKYDDTTVLKIWHFDGPISADGLALGAFLPREGDFPATLCLRPVTEDSF